MKSRVPPPGNARLFSDAQSGGPPAGVHIANIDGASRGNPGPAAYAVVLRDAEGKIVLELAKKIGRETNNVAEYYALLAALDYAVNQGISALRIRSDSELLVRQMQGRYKVKSPELKPLHERASKLAREIGYFMIEHVRRELNRDADALANVALDSGNVSNAAPAAPAAAPRAASGPIAAPAAMIDRPDPVPSRAPVAATVSAPARAVSSPAPRSFSRVSVRARFVR
ncbi:MAG: ribonuclease HI family protein, partial [Candidatus Acidiferrales bacterium]